MRGDDVGDTIINQLKAYRKPYACRIYNEQAIHLPGSKSLDFSGYFPQGRDDAIDDEIERSSIASVDIRCIETKLPQGRQALFYGFVRVGDSEIVV